MATIKKARRLLKREVMFIRRRLQGLDLDIMEAFVVKEVEAVEFHVTCYPERQVLPSWKGRSGSPSGAPALRGDVLRVVAYQETGLRSEHPLLR